MEPDPVTAYEGLDLTRAHFALIMTAVALTYAIPILIALSALVKLRRFPALRALHCLLLISVLLVGTLGLIEAQSPTLPDALRPSGTWAFIWIFAVAWLGVIWTRSAIKTRLRPRTLDIATLTACVVLALAIALPMTGLL